MLADWVRCTCMSAAGLRSDRAFVSCFVVNSLCFGDHSFANMVLHD